MPTLSVPLIYDRFGIQKERGLDYTRPPPAPVVYPRPQQHYETERQKIDKLRRGKAIQGFFGDYKVPSPVLLIGIAILIVLIVKQ